jgi:hypothetical protein
MACAATAACSAGPRGLCIGSAATWPSVEGNQPEDKRGRRVQTRIRYGPFSLDAGFVRRMVLADEMAGEAAFFPTGSPSIDSRLPTRRSVVLLI